MDSHNKHGSAKKRPAKARAAAGRYRWWPAGLLVLAAVAMAGYWLWGKYAAEGGPDTSKLLGQWQRPDGGYVLELSSAAPEGQLKAAYFNPRPINVARAQWKLGEGRLQVFVELRDVNYPGSTYTLRYDPATDRLAGIYFQAVQQQKFEVEFARKK